MKKYLFLVALVALLATPAFAGDLPMPGRYAFNPDSGQEQHFETISLISVWPTVMKMTWGVAGPLWELERQPVGLRLPGDAGWFFYCPTAPRHTIEFFKVQGGPPDHYNYVERDQDGNCVEAGTCHRIA